MCLVGIAPQIFSIFCETPLIVFKCAYTIILLSAAKNYYSKMQRNEFVPYIMGERFNESYQLFWRNVT